MERVGRQKLLKRTNNSVNHSKRFVTFDTYMYMINDCND